MNSHIHITVLVLVSFLVPLSVGNSTPENRNAVEGNLMVAYVSNWAQYRTAPYSFAMDSDIDPFAATHLVFAFATLSNGLPMAYEWNDESEPWAKGNYEKINDLKYQNPDLRVLLAFGGWNAGSEGFSEMVSTAQSRSDFIDAVIPFLRYPTCKDGPGTCYGFDGIDIDWEYPAARGGVPEDKDNLVLLIQEMRAAFQQEAMESGYEPLIISAAVPAGKTYIDAGYDVPNICGLLDFVNLMSYDLGGAWANETQHNAPLYNGVESEDGGELSVSWAANYWISSGCTSEKLIIGLPLYGRTFTLESAANGDIGAPVAGAGPAGAYTQESGFLANFEIEEQLDSGDCIRIWLDAQKVPYCVNNDIWIGYDDMESLSYKLQFIVDNNFGGAMVWALPLDDFVNGSPLYSFISSSILGEITPSESATPVPEVSPSPSPSRSVSPSVMSSVNPSPSISNECVAQWAQCGGADYSGPTTCCQGLECTFQSEWWSSCTESTGQSSETPSGSPSTIISSMTSSASPMVSASSSPSPIPSPSNNGNECVVEWEQCGGDGFTGNTECCEGLECVSQGQWWSSCQIASNQNPSETPSPSPSSVVSNAPSPSPSPSPSIVASIDPSPSPAAPGESNLSELLSEAQFNELFPNAGLGSCSGGSIFSYENLLAAAEYYPDFANTGDIQMRKRELAAFLGQTSQETSGWWSGQEYEWGFCFNSEVGCTNEVCAYCSPSSEFPCVQGKGYFGRGAIQLSYNYNYGLCSQDLYGDKNILLNNPDMVTQDGILAFRTALWFWMKPQSPKPSCHSVMTETWNYTADDIARGRYPGYGMVTNIINGGLECNQPTPQKVINRVSYYERYCSILGVSPGDHIYCDEMQSY